jgi:hypothetical protein
MCIEEVGAKGETKEMGEITAIKYNASNAT